MPIRRGTFSFEEQIKGGKDTARSKSGRSWRRKNSLQEKIEKKEEIFEKRLESMQQRNNRIADNSDDKEK